MNDPETLQVASQCRHYAMCKIDYLGTGLCQAGAEKHYVSYYPQGRMDLYRAFCEGRLPVTERLRDIADTCTLCRACEKQCYFVTEMKIMPVMEGLKDLVAAVPAEETVPPPPDSFVDELKAITGDEWSSNDPAILAAYATDPSPVMDIRLPRAVVMPDSTETVSAIVKHCNRNDVPYVVRGNGSSVMGFVFSEGVVIDMGRMKQILIDPVNWSATIGPGVAAFELQKAACTAGMRANLAETSALVCANIACSGIFSTFSAAYGTGADNYITATFVGPDGDIYRMDDPTAPNHFAFSLDAPPTGICTEAVMRLYPITPDETAVMIPFADFADAFRFAQELGMRRIGLAVAVLGLEYLTTFLSPTRDLADSLKQQFPERLGIQYMVYVVGDRYAISVIRQMTDTVIDGHMLKTLLLGLPKLADDELSELTDGLEGDRPLYETLFRPEMNTLLETVLDPGPETLSRAVDPDLQPFFTELYTRPEMSDPVWLNMFRIMSPRMGRKKHILGWIIYIPGDRVDLAEAVNERFREIADRHGLDHDFGFITPLDFAKRMVLEYDYYIDHTDPDEQKRGLASLGETAEMLENFCRNNRGVHWIKDLFGRGFSRKEQFLYR